MSTLTGVKLANGRVNGLASVSGRGNVLFSLSSEVCFYRVHFMQTYCYKPDPGAVRTVASTFKGTVLNSAGRLLLIGEVN